MRRGGTTTEKAISGVPIWPNSGVPGYATVNTSLLYAYQWRTRSYATDIWHLSVAYHLGTPLIYYWWRRYIRHAVQILVAYHLCTPLMMYLWRTGWYATDVFICFFFPANLWNISILINSRYSNIADIAISYLTQFRSTR